MTSNGAGTVPDRPESALARHGHRRRDRAARLWRPGIGWLRSGSRAAAAGSVGGRSARPRCLGGGGPGPARLVAEVRAAAPTVRDRRCVADRRGGGRAVPGQRGGLAGAPAGWWPSACSPGCCSARTRWPVAAAWVGLTAARLSPCRRPCRASAGPRGTPGAGRGHGSAGRAAARAGAGRLAVGVVLLVIFGSLFRAADPAFDALVAGWTQAISVAALVRAALGRPRAADGGASAVAYLSGTARRSARAANARRCASPCGVVEWAVPLAMLDALFGRSSGCR